MLWVDDLLTWAKSPVQLLERQEQVWQRLHAVGLKGAAAKLELYTEAVLWCGRYADGEGVWHDPRRIQGLLDLVQPRTAGDLMQFLCAITWMRMHLPQLAKISAPLQQLLEQKLTGARLRTKAAASRLGLSAEEWSTDCQEAWRATRRCLSESVKLAL